MNIIFKAKEQLGREEVLILTHPEKERDWQQLRQAIEKTERGLTVIDGRNDRTLQIPISAVTSIESEDRWCNIKVVSGGMYLYHKRLKYVEEELTPYGFMRINNQVIINHKEIKQFSATTNARIELLMKDGSTYFISRHYIKAFRRVFS
ncbi:LytTR family DNA-binding domain-containing protein [uncultured Enterococcus sp.]|uniref:LytTR family DNA-binding domain-containing protein n=1 Tax=uncultured Enterococcus sp. TaxID=167972 RepID=UPI002AA7FAF6|nr:LytTR family DNA-binding domain-containing protein [uncultured Enterococcus sp.]